MTATSVDEVLDLYRDWGDRHYDEAVSQLSHALQTAAAASGAGAGDELVAAALLHDVGHLLDLRTPTAAPRHEETGAAWLRPLFPASVTAPIALHVRAKRYLCAVDDTYVAGLSAGSLRSLARQHGPMSAEQVQAFEATPAFDVAVRLRGWDDGGKLHGADVPPLEDYRDLLLRIAL